MKTTVNWSRQFAFTTCGGVQQVKLAIVNTDFCSFFLSSFLQSSEKQSSFSGMNSTLSNSWGQVNRWGGKTIVFGRDPWQIPPVWADVVAISLKSSPLHTIVTELKLSQNMRVTEDNKKFRKWLLDICDWVCLDDPPYRSCYPSK